MAKRLGKQEVALLAYVQMRDLHEIRTGDLVGPLNLSARQEQTLLSRMNKSGLIAQIRRGLYLVPSKLPLGGVWVPDLALAVNALMADKQARYQICGPNAFNRYGFDEQIPARVYIYNDAISANKTIGSINYVLIKVSSDRLGSIETVKSLSGEPLIYSSRVRSLVDAVYDWSRFDSLPQAFRWITNDINVGVVKPAELVQTALKYGNTGTIRRIGAMLEKMQVKNAIIKPLGEQLPPTSAKIPLVPGSPTIGPLMKRWGVVDNAGQLLA